MGRTAGCSGRTAVVALLVGIGAAATLESAATASATAERIVPPAPEPPPLGGNPGGVPLPAFAAPTDTSQPNIVIGNGKPAECTSAAVVAAVATGGVITFNCSPAPVIIAMTAAAKVVNTSSTVVLDGGGLITLSGVDQRRILYMNTCDQAQIWTTSHCQNQAHPQLTLQKLNFTQDNATGDTAEGGGGGGGALRVLSQFDGRPVVVANSTFGGSPTTGNTCSNGGATSSIGVSWEIYNSVFTDNHAIGNGANPQRPGTPGGGNGGAIYLDGGTMTLDLAGSIVLDNIANEGGGGVFFVSNNRQGTLHIASSQLERNLSRGFNTQGFPGIFYLGNGPIRVNNSVTGRRAT